MTELYVTRHFFLFRLFYLVHHFYFILDSRSFVLYLLFTTRLQCYISFSLPLIFVFWNNVNGMSSRIITKIHGWGEVETCFADFIHLETAARSSLFASHPQLTIGKYEWQCHMHCKYYTHTHTHINRMPGKISFGKHNSEHLK